MSELSKAVYSSYNLERSMTLPYLLMTS